MALLHNPPFNPVFLSARNSKKVFNVCWMVRHVVVGLVVIVGPAGRKCGKES